MMEGGCFSTNSYALNCENGQNMPLVDLKRGDMVLSYHNGSIICSPIVASDISISKEPVDMVQIGFGKAQTISMTKNHIIYTVRNQNLVGVEAAELRIGDLILHRVSYVEVTKINIHRAIPVR